MDLRKAMIDEFEMESGLTRSVLQVVPDSLMDFQINSDFQSVRWNVSHLVDIPSWADMILRGDHFDVAPLGEPPHRTPEMPSIEVALEKFDQHVSAAKSAIEEFSLETLEDPWSLMLGGHALLTHPRYMIYRMYLVNHVAHHRGHLLVYLRSNAVETPRLYG